MDTEGFLEDADIPRACDDPLAAAREEGRRDGCVVESRALSVLLFEYAQSYGRRHPEIRQDLSAQSIAWLVAERAGLSEGTVANLLTVDEEGNPCGRYFTTELWIADAIITAIDRPDVFYDGDKEKGVPPTLVIYRNPAAKGKAQRACCAGDEFPLAERQRSVTVSLEARLVSALTTART